MITRLLKIIISVFVGLAEITLGLRVLFRLFDANHTQLVTWVYQTSDQLLQPFRGIFQADHLTSGHVLDFTALFGVLVYALFGFVLTRFIGVFKRSKSPKKKPKD